ncbi:transposase and inactivated derivative (plasmid) [Methylobacterium nodulans ORS 2060]|uniref:Transposase and inactivated derivative n=1 Tax=Methylobacterium nodulans (strain LMG 21967 / CNCM I-2342 / ORS 2060) TaxID=460265 RepID=B8IW47_METNO|nr:transposase and inactivated derivative [Methylobacterium nodulans ORS 2060]
MDQLTLSNEQWERIAPHLPGKAGDPGRTAADTRLFVEALFWMARVGSPWRDLPASFGKWNSVFQRFRRWTQKG